MTSRHDFQDDPAPAEAGSPRHGYSEPTQLIDPPRIPVGLPHVVQFVEGSLYNESLTVQNVGSKMSRYANKDGVVSIALDFICRITGLGSHHTATHAIEVMISLGVIEKHPGQGGHDRKSNSYRFLGERRQWTPPKAIPPGTNLPAALRKSLEDNEALAQENDDLRAQVEELQARLALLTNGHTAVTDGGAPDPTDSYEPEDSEDPDRTIRHSEVTDGRGDTTPETAPHSYETGNDDSPPGNSGAIRHSGVTDGLDEGQEYLARRERVQALVMEHRGYYGRSFRGGLLSAIEFFSRNEENEAELVRQVDVLRAGQEPAESGSDPPWEREAPSVPMTASGRREVEYCPDCGSPYTTFRGAEYCPDCTDRRRREGEA